MQNKISHDSETPAKGQQVITVTAFIYKNFDGVIKLFLPCRATTKKFLPSEFELPGGHLNFGEDFIDGLKREIKEELGMEIIVGEPFEAFTYVNEIKGSHSAEVIFFARFEGDIEKIKLNPEDHSEYKWITKKEIPEILSGQKKVNDPEIRAIYKGFGILKMKFR